MQKTLLCLALLSTLWISGCGNSKNDNNNDTGVFGQQSQAGFQGVQGYCAPEVIDAFNNFVVRCNSIPSEMDMHACRFTAEHFLRNWQGISCVAMPVSPGPYSPQYYGSWRGQQVFHITDYPMRNVLAALEQYRMGNSNWRSGHYNHWPRLGRNN